MKIGNTVYFLDCNKVEETEILKVGTKWIQTKNFKFDKNTLEIEEGKRFRKSNIFSSLKDLQEHESLERNRNLLNNKIVSIYHNIYYINKISFEDSEKLLLVLDEALEIINKLKN